MTQRISLFCAFVLCLLALALFAATASADSTAKVRHTSIEGGTVTPTSTYAASPTSTSTPVCVTAWEVIDAANPGPLDDHLADISALSANNVWAVGSYVNDTGYQYLTRIDHWNGAQWETVHSPSVVGPDFITNELHAVDAIAPDNVWAVGYYAGPSPRFIRHTLIEHWDGTEWRIVPSPDGEDGSNYLYDIDARTPDDIWAVGYSYSVNAFKLHTLTLHWDGTSWTSIPAPNPSSASNVFYGVSASSANDAWAVGYYFDDAAQARSALIAHWDGIYWTQISAANGGLESFLEDVTALSATDAWAVGYANEGSGAAQTLIQHWDGTNWTLVPSPNGSAWTNFLHGVSSVSSTDIWAAGEYYDDRANTSSLILHWDGKAWTIQPSPSPGNLSNSLDGISALALDDVWVAGTFSIRDAYNETLIERFTSSCATPVPTLTPLPTPTACEIQFTDVPENSTFYAFVRCLACRGIAGGYTTGCETGSPCFKPGETVTRAQLAKMVSNAAGLSDPPGSPRFQDVPAGSTFYYFIQRLAD